MKKAISLLLSAAMILSLAACAGQNEPQTDPITQPEENVAQNWEGATTIELSDEDVKVTIDGILNDVDLNDLKVDQKIPCISNQSNEAAVTVSRDVIYYEEGHDFTYGEGEEGDGHSAEEAAAHTVVTIIKPGTYVLSGKLSAGQIAVDLGEDAEEDPEAVVTLVLNGVDVTCTVAPAIIFYNVYECGSDDAETATRNVDTSAAGANVYINGGTENNICGSYVARIYKPESVVLSADGTEVEDAKKLHKYDAAFYSRMSMNVDGDNSGVLRIDAENEGLDSELHLTINGGTIFIESGNDGINTNEDGVSVTTVNGGTLTIMVTGETGEGDGIDSNGWLVLNGGTVAASACNNSMDAGIDSDMGIHIGEGATVMAFGHMLDRIEGAEQNYAVFQFGGTQSGEEEIVLKNADGAGIMADALINDYSVLIYSSPTLTAGDYTLWSGGTQLGHSGTQGGGMMGFPGGRPDGQPPEGFDPEDLPQRPNEVEGGKMERPEPPEGFDPEYMPEFPEGMEPPEGMGMGGGRGPSGMPGMGGMNGGQNATQAIFTISAKENYFSGVGALEQ